MALIEFKGVGYEETSGAVVFKDADVSFGVGERVVIVGEGGGGTKAFMGLTGGISVATEGTVTVLGTVFGTEVSGGDLERARASMGLVFRNFSLISNLKVIENVALPIAYHMDMAPAESLEKAAELLRGVGYDGDPWTLPGPLPDYDKKLISVARAVSLEPKLVAAEDILEGLDEEQKARIAAVLLRYHYGGDRGRGEARRLLVVMVQDERDAEYLAPTRVVKIEGRRFTG